MTTPEYILTLSCPDQRGIVHSVSGFLATHGCNIIDSAQFGDADSKLFFMRVHFSADDSQFGDQVLRDDFAALATGWGMHWQLHKHGAAHHRDQEKRGAQRMEVAVAIGAEPVTNFAATLPLPDDLDEMIFASFLREKPVEMVKCVSVDLEVPATAEIVLEGYVDPAERRIEGPFGDHTGFYTLEEPYAVFHVTTVTHRKNPIYQTTIVGRPPMEDCWMGRAIIRVTLPVLKRQMPEIVDMNLPFEGVFHNLMLVSIRKQYPGHARKVMNAIWGMGQAMFTKCIVVVDEDVNVQDPSEVAWKVLNNIDPERDIQFTMGPIDVLDHASRQQGYGSKMGVDGTRKWKNEGFDRLWPKENNTSEEVKRLVDAKWKKLGL